MCPGTAPCLRTAGVMHALPALLSAGVVPRRGATVAHAQKHVIGDPCASTACRKYPLCGVLEPQNHHIVVLALDAVESGTNRMRQAGRGCRHRPRRCGGHHRANYWPCWACPVGGASFACCDRACGEGHRPPCLCGRAGEPRGPDRDQKVAQCFLSAGRTRPRHVGQRGNRSRFVSDFHSRCGRRRRFSAAVDRFHQKLSRGGKSARESS